MSAENSDSTMPAFQELSATSDLHVEAGIIGAAIVDDFDRGADAADMRRDRLGGQRRARGRHVRFEPNRDFEFQPEPPVIRAPDARPRSKHALCEHDARDRMVDPAEILHRRRGQSDLVADGIAMRAPQQRDEALLDIIGVRDGGGPVRRVQRLELQIGGVGREQRFALRAGPRGRPSVLSPSKSWRSLGVDDTGNWRGKPVFSPDLPGMRRPLNRCGRYRRNR